jgi:hypothetical protein
MVKSAKDPATGICAACVAALRGDKLTRGTGLVTDGNGLCHVKGPRWEDVAGKPRTACHIYLSELEGKDAG